MLAAILLGAAVAAAPPDTAYRFAASVARDGRRPAAGAGERRAQSRVAARFRRAGLRVAIQPVPVGGKGRSRNVIGSWDGARRCLRIVMAHADTVAGTQGANDNASGLGALAGLAPRIRAIRPPCDVWLVATGAEERIYTGFPDHLGALALARRARGRALRYALSLDEVGGSGGFLLRSPAARPRPGIEGELLAAARRARVRLGWARDSGSGNSDHREFELAGMRGAKLGNRGNACRHQRCDTVARLYRLPLARTLRVVEEVLKRR